MSMSSIFVLMMLTKANGFFRFNFHRPQIIIQKVLIFDNYAMNGIAVG